MKNSRVFKSVPLLLLPLLLCANDGFAQTGDKALRIIARHEDSSVVLRWAPASPALWDLGRKNGYRVERAPLSGSGMAGAFEPLNDGKPWKPWEEGVWGYFISQEKNMDSTRMMYAHIAYSMLQTDSANAAGAGTLEERRQVLEMQYSFGLLAADRDRLASIGLALRYEDWYAEPRQRYLYRVTMLGNLPNGVSAFDTISVGPEIYRAPKRAGALSADELDHAVTIRWKAYPDYGAHRVERSDDGGKTYRALNSAPIITLISGDTLPSGVEHFADTALTDYQVYHYRVYGYTPFGDDELIGEIKAMPRDRTPPDMPTDVHATNTGTNSVTLTWKMIDPVPGDLAGFYIGRDTAEDGRYPRLTKTMLPVTARSYVDNSGNFSRLNFYAVEAVDTAGNIIRSYGAYAVMVDSIPPEKPVLVHGVMDTNGVVTLTLKAPPDRDLMGYRLLRANDEAHEFSVIREYMGSDSSDIRPKTTLNDTVTVRTLTRYVYYRLVALDYHFNESPTSATLAVRRPDLVPPVAPVITNYFVDDSAISVDLVQSSSEDVWYQVLCRRNSGTGHWDSIATLRTGQSRIVDGGQVMNAEYDYALQAVDSAGLRSEYSNIITAKRYDTGVRPAVRNLRVSFDPLKKSVGLTWQYNDIGENFWFIIYRSEGAGLRSFAVVRNKALRTFTDPNPPDSDPEVRYAVKVVAESGGESGLSDAVNVRLK